LWRSKGWQRETYDCNSEEQFSRQSVFSRKMLITNERYERKPQDRHFASDALDIMFSSISKKKKKKNTNFCHFFPLREKKAGRSVSVSVNGCVSDSVCRRNRSRPSWRLSSWVTGWPSRLSSPWSRDDGSSTSPSR